MQFDKSARNIPSISRASLKEFAERVHNCAASQIQPRGAALALIAVYVFGVGLAGWIAEHALLREARALFADLTPAYRPERPSIYGSFIAYVLFWFSVVGGAAAAALLGMMPRLKTVAEVVAGQASGPILTISLVLALVITPEFSRICFMVAGLILIVRAAASGGLTLPPKSISISVRVVLALLGVVAAVGIIASVWFPLRMPNDYMELPERIRVAATAAGAAPTILSRSEAIDCVISAGIRHEQLLFGEAGQIGREREKLVDLMATLLADESGRGRVSAALRQRVADDVRPPQCPVELDLAQANSIAAQLRATGGWHSAPGRAFYHHSYLFVPAMHLLRHGLGVPVPYLYGLGNTAFHALLMSDNPTLTRYFETFPVAQLLGLLIIAGLVWGLTRSIYSLPIAASVAILMMANIGYEPLYFAGGFSPLRYAGLALQVASIFVMFRRGGRSIAGVSLVCLALAASLIWNREFGIIGATGQLLALLFAAPGLSASRRAIYVGLFGTMALGSIFWLRTLSTGFAENIQVGVYGVPFLPTLTRAEFAALCLVVATLVLALVCAAWRFSQFAERGARLCIIPVLALLAIKFIYCASPIHLLFTLAFVLPVCLVYFDWGHDVEASSPGHRLLTFHVTGFAMVALAALALVTAVRYANAAGQRDAVMIEPLVTQSWGRLGESFATATLAEPIEQRVEAARAMVRPDDAVLFLSPFDHLLAFYVNPARYCGHFDNVTNLVTHKMIADVASCVAKASSAVVVYDEAVDTECPKGTARSFADMGQCRLKRQLMLNVKGLMETLTPKLELVGKKGPLTFYRIKEKQS
ncbi:MAG: hypothetical protein NW217_13285 [Hyphomicrobiaceae bacterium]|nr:hypothetical protein [Hyphomicrobiaceae bacterium]